MDASCRLALACKSASAEASVVSSRQTPDPDSTGLKPQDLLVECGLAFETPAMSFAKGSTETRLTLKKRYDDVPSRLHDA
jgi:hypothetical protein